ncbi:NAD-dependent epimerase/dehydratase family protein [Eleftheria terrae]|uniref:NAD-dependent epimerase/dehydratase family protein n=1 Tax=Eleftheria terrae TaxID=1597781 RepID=UPI00263A6CDA|nr:NAD(P)-dependent oxidoreductase [Eleftheria terrae]WKB53559.1 NAD(P)-dependent oxidoreductase [Eleftheria terrae]
MKVLVTGATSGLGRNAVDDLLQHGLPLRATGRNLQQGAALQQLGVDFEPADLSLLTPVQADRLLRDVDTVWHCAALSSPWGPRRAFEAANVEATRRLAEAAVRQGVRRFVHISTPSLYFDFRHRQQIDEAWRPARPVNAYAATKGEAEAVLQSIASRHAGTTVVMLRPRAIFGPHDRVIVPRLLALMRQRGGVLPLPGGGRARMDMTYVGNVVHAMHLASRVPGLRSGSVYNITNQAPTTLADLLQRLFVDQLGLPLRIRALPYPLLAGVARLLEAGGRLTGREPPFTRYSMGALHYEMTLDTGRARRELGWQPVIDLDEGIRRTAAWIRAHGTPHGL